MWSWSLMVRKQNTAQPVYKKGYDIDMLLYSLNEIWFHSAINPTQQSHKNRNGMEILLVLLFKRSNLSTHPGRFEMTTDVSHSSVSTRDAESLQNRRSVMTPAASWGVRKIVITAEANVNSFKREKRVLVESKQGDIARDQSKQGDIAKKQSTKPTWELNPLFSAIAVQMSSRRPRRQRKSSALGLPPKDCPVTGWTHGRSASGGVKLEIY